MNLIKGVETDFYRLYKDDKNVYHHFKGKYCDLKFKSKVWNRTINFNLQKYPLTNFKVLFIDNEIIQKEPIECLK